MTVCSSEHAKEICVNMWENIKKAQKGLEQGNTTNMSVADEILKFKNLLDEGIITQEEFDLKKKQLLGL